MARDLPVFEAIETALDALPFPASVASYDDDGEWQEVEPGQ